MTKREAYRIGYERAESAGEATEESIFFALCGDAYTAPLRDALKAGIKACIRGRRLAGQSAGGR